MQYAGIVGYEFILLVVRYIVYKVRLHHDSVAMLGTLLERFKNAVGSIAGNYTAGGRVRLPVAWVLSQGDQ